MKNFEVEYIKDGKRQKMFLKASDRVSAQNIVKSQKSGVIVKVGETKTVPLSDQIAEATTSITRLMGMSKKIKIPNLVASVRQLAVMTNAGISIHDSIKEVANSTEDKRLKEVFSSLNDDLNAGLSLTEAAAKFRAELGDVVISMFSLGESTGNMAEALTKLSSILQDVWDNQQKFKKAMRYPITVIIAIAVAFLVLILFVVPKFREIFEELGANLPLPTRILLGIENVLSNYGLWVLAGFIIFIFGIKFILRNNEEAVKIKDKYILKVYLIGKIIFFSTMSRFTLIFTELVRSGIPIADSLETACKMVDNYALKVKLSSVKLSVEQGVSLTDALRNTELFESMLMQMVSAGEQSGSLDIMLKNVADYYKMKFDEIIDNISSYIEPILLFFMAALVVLLALGIFMPMWDLGSAAKG
ncbi:transformation system, membrane protein CtsF [Campylobacter blaseri]|uniref:Type II secretion system protein F n=1 Tax=Campylobacter blaseri TaxID=2042961 RepID=A0A2P8R2H3_9BACT|nr:type II secretion system F family protein [Campylobacter blaseri]PSM52706.1 type II secretion system protein F [Campylobacter blaseri]PSM54354.1 type II secretion system protein F [Campylobacter blaseri]QKF86007.1 transformation system, membrane protein CtsF [Campylobacter blaseri]